MATFVALLRGVNTGGRTLSMADLERVTNDLGYANVQTYGQSGTMVFEAPGGEPNDHADAIAVAIERDLGPRVGVLVLTPEDLGQVVAGNPYPTEAGVDEEWLQVMFLFAAESDFGPSSVAASSDAYRAAFGKLELPAAHGERVMFAGTPEVSTPVLYACLRHGGGTKLTSLFFERTLGTAVTARDWRTVLAVEGLARVAERPATG